MKSLPALDLHAHVDPGIAAGELDALESVVFAVTRSLDEAEAALARADKWTAWGVGCHPRLTEAYQSFSISRFTKLIGETAFVSEIGLDGQSPVPMAVQRQTLDAVLERLQHSPRITSIHSFEAAEEVLAALEAQPIAGAVLHWWLGTVEQTRRAVEMGCYFSVNASSVRELDVLNVIPLDRILTETDHPFGDGGGGYARPGGVDGVEHGLGTHFGLSSVELRFTVWENFQRLAREARCTSMLPRAVRVRLATI